MKKLLVIAAAVALLAACDESEDCVIKGTVPGDVSCVTLIDANRTPIDSCYVADGQFRLVCERHKDAPVAVTVNNYSEPTILVPESSSITLKIGPDGVVSIKGSKASKEFNDLQKWAVNFYMEANNELEKLFAAGDNQGAEDYMDGRNALIVKHCKPIFNAHKDDYVGVQAMVLMHNKLEKEEFLALYEKAGDCVKNDFRVSAYYNSVNR